VIAGYGNKKPPSVARLLCPFVTAPLLEPVDPPVPLLDGWSARAAGGLAAKFSNGAAFTFGGELGGIGSNIQIWTWRARGSVPF
jgi:hypothetical protein